MVQFFEGRFHLSARPRTVFFMVFLFASVLMTGFSLGAAIFVYEYVPADIAIVKADTLAMQTELQNRKVEMDRNAEAFRMMIEYANKPRPKQKLPERVTPENMALGVGGD